MQRNICDLVRGTNSASFQWHKRFPSFIFRMNTVNQEEPEDESCTLCTLSGEVQLPDVEILDCSECHKPICSCCAYRLRTSTRKQNKFSEYGAKQRPYHCPFCRGSKMRTNKKRTRRLRSAWRKKRHNCPECARKMDYEEAILHRHRCPNMTLTCSNCSLHMTARKLFKHRKACTTMAKGVLIQGEATWNIRVPRTKGKVLRALPRGPLSRVTTIRRKESISLYLDDQNEQARALNATMPSLEIFEFGSKGTKQDHGIFVAMRENNKILQNVKSMICIVDPLWTQAIFPYGCDIKEEKVNISRLDRTIDNILAKKDYMQVSRRAMARATIEREANPSLMNVRVKIFNIEDLAATESQRNHANFLVPSDHFWSQQSDQKHQDAANKLGYEAINNADLTEVFDVVEGEEEADLETDDEELESFQREINDHHDEMLGDDEDIEDFHREALGEVNARRILEEYGPNGRILDDDDAEDQLDQWTLLALARAANRRDRENYRMRIERQESLASTSPPCPFHPTLIDLIENEDRVNNASAPHGDPLVIDVDGQSTTWL